MMREKIILICILIKISQSIYIFIESNEPKIDIFESYSFEHISFNPKTSVYCNLINEDYFIFRGRFQNILEILDKEKIPDSNNIKIEGYKYVYFPDNSLYNEYADLFPNSTIFVKFYKPIQKNNCHILLDLSGFERSYKYESSVPYYLSINKKTQETSFHRVDEVDIVFCHLIPLYIILFCIYFYKLCNCSILCFNLRFYVFTRRLILLCIPLIVSNLLMKYILPIALFHSLYKSYILINLIFLLDGNSILKFENANKLFRIYLFICFVIDGSLNLLINYIVYYIPSVNNLYLNAMKDLVEHIALLIYTFKSYETKYFHFYNQYIFEIRLKCILSLFYLFKIVIYQKVIKFAFFYSCVFIGFQIYKMIFLYDFADAFYFNYFLNTCLEVILIFILVKMFYPQNLPLFYFIPVFYDYNSKIYKVQITKEENNLNISNLNKNILKDEYKKNNEPLVFIGPFSKSNQAFNNIQIGMIVEK